MIVKRVMEFRLTTAARDDISRFVCTVQSRFSLQMAEVTFVRTMSLHIHEMRRPLSGLRHARAAACSISVTGLGVVHPCFTC